MEYECTLYQDGFITVRGVDYETSLVLHQVLSAERIVLKWQGKSGRYSALDNRSGWPTTLMVWKIKDLQRHENDHVGYFFTFTRVVEQIGDIRVRTDENAYKELDKQYDKLVTAGLVSAVY